MSLSVHAPRLTVTNGPHRGASYELPIGRVTIGRGAEAEVFLPDGSVSRQHATVDRSHGRIVLTDLGSSNGTRVNGQPLHGSRELRDGDAVVFGSFELTFHASPTAPAGGGAVDESPDPPPRSGLTGGQLARAMIFAALAGVTALLFESVLTWVRGLGGPVAWLAVGCVAAAGGVASMLLSLARDRAVRRPSTRAPHGPYPPGPAPPPAPPTHVPPYRPPRAPARRGRLPIVAVVVIILLLCGAGGVAVTPGVQRAVSWVQGMVCPQCEPGEDWLVGPVDGSAGALTVTVSEVEVNSRVIKVSLTAANDGGESLSLNAGFSHFTVAGQTFRYEGAGDFTIDAPPGGVAHGVFVYDGVPPRSATEASLSFTTIFGFGPESLTVTPIALRAPP